MRHRSIRTTAALSALAVLAAFALPAAAQNGEGPQVYQGAELIEVITPIVFDGDLRDLPTVEPWRPGDPIKEIPRRFYPREGGFPEPGTSRPADQGPDPLVDLQASAAPDVTDQAFGTPILNFAGQGYTGVNPSDPVGDVGPSYYIQMINAAGGAVYTIYDKTNGAVVAGPTFLDSLGSGFCGGGLGDPIVLYDQLAGRWLLSEFSSSGNRMCVYISQTGDPVAGGWYAYDFQAPSFPDYPKYAVWPDAYYVGTNESGPSPGYAFERSQMLDGLPAGNQRLTAPDIAGFGFQMLTPSDLDGSTPPPAGAPNYFMRHRDDEVHNAGSNDPTQDFLEIWEFSVDWVAPANSTFTGPINVPITEIDSDLCGLVSFFCFPQPGTSVTLDPLREVVMWRNVYRNNGGTETLVGNLVTDVTGTDLGGVRWYELRKSGGTWSVFQEGTYSIDTDSRWMGSIAMDVSGNIALGYNVSSSVTFPGLRYAGRLSTDALGTLPQGEYLLVDGTGSNSSNRYGDYNSMNLDESDGCTFWFTGQWNPTSNWATQIGAFSFASCGGTCGNGVREGAEECDGADLGGATCADVGCTGGSPTCTATCTLDYAGCTGCPACDNDGTCDFGEICDSCGDCPSGPEVGTCGNGVCEPGEDCLDCPADCNGKQNGKPDNRFCCSGDGLGGGTNPVDCTDSRCTDGAFDCATAFCCGDGFCEPGESCGNCAVDCNTEPDGELTCDDGLDNDCDGFFDCDDSDCTPQQICQPVDCSQFTTRKTCNAQADCAWDNRNKVCLPV